MNLNDLSYDVRDCTICEGTGIGNDNRLGKGLCDNCGGKGKISKIHQDEKYWQYRAELRARTKAENEAILAEYRALPPEDRQGVIERLKRKGKLPMGIVLLFLWPSVSVAAHGVGLTVTMVRR